ncbi:hypothetical protein ACFL3G_07410 [Planctomycetota bacterium]
MIEKIDNNQINNIVGKSSSDPGNTAANNTGSEVDALVQVNHDGLIEQASQLPQSDPNAVERALELLASGELESDENIRAAAENIIKFGI